MNKLILSNGFQFTKRTASQSRGKRTHTDTLASLFGWIRRTGGSEAENIVIDALNIWFFRIWFPSRMLGICIWVTTTHTMPGSNEMEQKSFGANQFIISRATLTRLDSEKYRIEDNCGGEQGREGERNGDWILYVFRLANIILNWLGISICI